MSKKINIQSKLMREKRIPLSLKIILLLQMHHKVMTPVQILQWGWGGGV